MRELLVIELKIPWRYDLGWKETEVNSRRIEWLKDCIEDTSAIEATFIKAHVGTKHEEHYNLNLITERDENKIKSRAT